MVYIFDYTPLLEKFEWPLSIHQLAQRYINLENDTIVHKFNGYGKYFKYIQVIWSRIISDFKTYGFLKDTRNERVFFHRYESHVLSADEKDLISTTDAAQTMLEVDYESFLIFTNILMDKTAQIAATILGNSEIPTRSFNDHKKYFVKNSSISHPIKEEYAKLIIERTEWYDISLVLARDKLVAHGSTYTIGIHGQTSTGGLRIVKENIFGDFAKEAKQIIAIKRKYEDKYPELKSVCDNLWEVIDFFMNYNIKLDKDDKSVFIQIVHNTGGSLPSLYFLARNIKDFLENFAKAFES